MAELDFKKRTFLLNKVKKIQEFSGSSPPEIFIGRWNYPNVYTGLLAPDEIGNSSILSSSESWHKSNLQIPQILKLRQQLIYSRTQNQVKTPKNFLPVIQQTALAHKPLETHIKLKKPIFKNPEKESRVPLISHASKLDSAKIISNPKIHKKADYLSNDIHVKSSTAIQELHRHIPVDSIIKILSAGLLGLKKNRKLVPTRWSITATDSTISEAMLKKIKSFPVLQNFQVFTAEYLGNHYEFLLLPKTFQFEVIEYSLKSSQYWQDSETIFKRKTYASDVTGAYYTNRLAVCEYLTKIKKQASCLVIREIRPEYYAPLGVGILRATSRDAFSKKPQIFQDLQQALQNIQYRLRSNITGFTSRSKILNSKQKTLFDF
jgi:hypothetical protein